MMSCDLMDKISDLVSKVDLKLPKQLRLFSLSQQKKLSDSYKVRKTRIESCLWLQGTRFRVTRD